MIILEFIGNIAILLALSMVYTLLFEGYTRKTVRGRCLFGFILGIASVIGMLTPMTFAEGIIFDGRSIFISLAGLFGGGVSAGIAGGIALVCRLIIGGAGAVVGSLLIVVSAVLGIIWYHWRIKKSDVINTFHLFLFGVVVHIAMVLLMFGMPVALRMDIIRAISFPVLILYPAGTVLAGRLFVLQDERTRARRDLKENQDFLARILRTAPSGIGIVKNEILIEANPCLSDLTGYRHDELIGHSLELLFLNEQVYAAYRRDREQKLHAKGVAVLETTWRRKDGAEIWVVLSCSRFGGKDARGDTMFSALEITDRKRMETALCASEKKLREAQQMARLGTWRWELNSGSVEWSDEVYRIFGLNPKTFTPLVDSIMARSPWAEEYERHQKMIKDVTRHRYKQGVFEQRFLRADGTVGFCSSTFRGVYDSAGTLTAVEGTVQDITKSKKAAEAVQVSSKRLALHVEQTPLAVIEWSLDLMVMEWNPAAEKLFGYTAEEAIGQSAKLIVSESVWPGLMDAWSQILLHKQGTFSANENLTKDGRTIFCEWTSTPLTDESGTVVGVASFAMDVTRRRRTDEAIRVLAEADASGGGAQFLKKITCELGRVLDADVVQVGAYRDDESTAVDSLAVCSGGKILDNFSYTLAGTPCETVMDSGICAFSQGVTDLFPDDESLRKMGIEGMVGVPLYGPAEKNLGVMMVQFRKPILDVEFVISILQLFSGRIGASIEQGRAAEKMEQLARFPAENPNVVMRVSPEGVVHYANQSSAALLACWGVDVGQAIPSTFWQIGQLALESKESIETEIACALQTYLLNFVPVLAEGYVDIYGREITERKRVEGERERLLFAIEQTAEIIIITDATADARIQYVNSAFEKITGYDRTEAIGQNPRLLKSGKQTAEFYHEMWATLEAGESWNGQLVNKKKNGSLYTEEATISPVVNPHGKIISYVAAKRDVTHELALEGQLRQAQKMEAVGQMAGGIAHDFNNLLQVVSGYAELMLMKLPANDSHAFAVEEIGKAARRGKGLVSQLLAFSRRQVINPIDLDLNETIIALINMIKGWIGEHIHLEMIQGERLGIVHADRGMVEQVLMNLCVNARDAMPNGGTLTIETENVVMDEDALKFHSWATQREYVLLSILDTGDGMDGQTKGRIFEPFFTTKEVGKGTGLGLSMAFGIIKQHQGHISVCSEKGNGTTFKIYLPSVERQATEAPSREVVEGGGGTETLLLAEDDPSVLQLAEYTLSEAGYTVLVARDGLEALRLFEKNIDRIDLVMMDVLMPRMGGKEAMDRILELRPDTRHFFASGYNENAAHTNFIQNRGMHLLGKPYQTQELLQKVRELLDAPPD